MGGKFHCLTLLQINAACSLRLLPLHMMDLFGLISDPFFFLFFFLVEAHYEYLMECMNTVRLLHATSEGSRASTCEMGGWGGVSD